MRRGCGPAFSLCAMSENDFEGLWVRLPRSLSSNRTFTSGHTVVGLNGRHACSSSQRFTSGKLQPKGRLPHQVPPLSVVPIPIANILTNALISVDIEWPNHGEIIAKRK